MEERIAELERRIIALEQVNNQDFIERLVEQGFFHVDGHLDYYSGAQLNLITRYLLGRTGEERHVVTASLGEYIGEFRRINATTFFTQNTLIAENMGLELFASGDGFLPTGLNPALIYYAVNVNSGEFSVASTPGGSAISTGLGEGQFYWKMT